MKINLFRLLLIVLVLFATSSISFRPQKNMDVLSVFRQVADKLNNLNAVSYRYLRELNYPDEKYISKFQSDVCIDFSEENDLIGFRYLAKYNNGFSVFNNSEIFDGDEKYKTLDVRKKPNSKNFEGKSVLFNSYITLKSGLPLIINDTSVIKTVTDTLYHNKPCYNLSFTLHKRLLNYYLGRGYDAVTLDYIFKYEIIADKATHLPLAVIQTNINNKNLCRTDFENIDTKPQAPAEKLWYYSSYLKEYTPQKSKKPVEMIRHGIMAPSWQLTNYTTEQSEKLAQYKGKVVLMEFWIKNCGYCINAVPKLNELNTKFAHESFKLLAINTSDSHNSISNFISRLSPNYTVLTGTTDIEKNYGITAYPRVVLIDKSGIIIYAGDLDIQKLEPLILKAI